MEDVARQGSRVMLFTLYIEALAALAIGHHYGTLPLALGVGGVLLVLGTLSHLVGRGHALGWVPLTVCNVAFIALHIQLGRGTLEFHFGVFVLLGVLLVYRDWRPIVLAAALFAVHHIVFDRLQAMNLGFFCTPEPNFLKIVMHAAYVIAQTGVEVAFAISLRRAALASSELSTMLRTIDGGDTLRLDVAALEVRSPVALVLKSALEKVSLALSEVRQVVASIENASQEIASGTRDLSQRTESQAGNLQRAAASMAQLTEAVRHTAETARQATTVAATAASAAEDGGHAVGTVASSMDGIVSASRRIDDINGVIDAIAFQTNILALNAAVEAARAGDEGRGFAVVAAEVRLLAQRSAAAAKEIKGLIAQSVEQVDRGTTQVGSAGESVDRVVGQARQVSQLLGEISDATSQQMQGIVQVGESVTELDAATRQNAGLVEHSAAAAQSLREQALRLEAVLRRFVLSPRPAT